MRVEFSCSTDSRQRATARCGARAKSDCRGRANLVDRPRCILPWSRMRDLTRVPYTKGKPTMRKTPLTAVGAEMLRSELHQLKTVERPRVIAAIQEARSHGDLSENAEYDAAKERQAFI